MAEGRWLFSLDYDRFNEILNQQNWFNLQHEFETAGISLSQNFLIWRGEAGDTWLLADFKTKRTYDLKRNVKLTEGETTVEISGPSSQEEQLIELTDPRLIFSRLQQSPQGTDEGFVDFVKEINLEKVNLEKLKRSDLAGAGFSFESGYQNLSTIYTMFCEILNSSREAVIDLSRTDLQQLVNDLRHVL